MKILKQDRRNIIEMPKKVWVNRECVCSSAGILGKYPDRVRAKDVLLELFESYQNKEKTFVMPEE